MFMIVSQKGRNLIAIGEKLLRVWGMADVYDAAQAYESGRIKFSRRQGLVQLGEGRKLKCQVSDVASVIGDLLLCVVRIPACGEEIDEEIEEDIDISPRYKKRYKHKSTTEIEEDIADNLLEILEEEKKEKLKRSKKTSSPKKSKTIKEKPKPKKEISKELKKSDEKEKKIPDKEPPLNSPAHLISQPEDMALALESKEKEESQPLKSNSEGIDIDSLLMDDESTHLLIDDEKESSKEKVTPKIEEEKEEDFDLDNIFEDKEETKEEIKKEKETQSKDQEEEPKEVEIELDLEDLLSIDEEEKKKKDFQKKDSDDILDLDDLLDETPKRDKATQPKTKEEDDFDLDLDLFEDEKKTPKTSQTGSLDDVLDDDLDLDSIFEMSQAEEKKLKEEPKKEAKEAKKEKTLDDDLDFDSLFDDVDTSSLQTKESKNIDDDLDIDDLDFDSLFGEEKTEKKEEPKKAAKAKPAPEPMPVDLDDDLLSLKDEGQIERELKAQATTTKESKTANKWKNLIDQFDIDIEKNAKKIEFSVEEYEDLLESFIRDSKDMENTLRFGSAQDKSSVISTLSDAVSMLHLNPLDQLLHDILNSNEDEANSAVDTFYSILNSIEEKIEKSKDQRKFATNKPSPQPEPSQKEEELIIPEIEDETPKQESSQAGEKIISVDEFLKDVKMIPIEFSIKLAADELNLPDDLVLEFVNDFSNQGHENIPELIDAYQKGDLDRLQKIAHMLKGAASNLRIEPMVQNLYDLQFDNDITRAPERIRIFAGQLMSLDKYLQQVSNN